MIMTMTNDQIYASLTRKVQAYRINTLEATDTKCLRANVYELTNYAKPKHLATVPMDYRFDTIITCCIREVEIRTGLTFFSWYYVTNDKHTIVAVFTNA